MPFNYLRFRPTTSFGTAPLSVSVPFIVSHLSLLDCPSMLAVHMLFPSHVVVIDPCILFPTEPENMNRVLQYLCILDYTIQKELIKCWLTGCTHKKISENLPHVHISSFSFIAISLSLSRSLFLTQKSTVCICFMY